VLHEWPWIGVANTWYLKRATDAWEVEGKPEAYFRLLQPDFTPLPVYSSMADYTATAAVQEAVAARLAAPEAGASAPTEAPP
jgi:hypothetical protein